MYVCVCVYVYICTCKSFWFSVSTLHYTLVSYVYCTCTCTCTVRGNIQTVIQAHQLYCCIVTTVEEWYEVMVQGRRTVTGSDVVAICIINTQKKSDKEWLRELTTPKVSANISSIEAALRDH